MSVIDMIRIHRAALFATAALTVAVTLGCSGAEPGPVVASATPPPRVDPGVDYQDPDRVCEAFAGVVYRADTAVDAGRGDAYQRAAVYLHPALADAIARFDVTGQDPQWQVWAAHRARTHVQLNPYPGDVLQPDDGEERHRAVLLTVSPLGRDGWRGPSELHTVYCTLRPAPDGWRISSYATD